jgi:hypothetical protein
MELVIKYFAMSLIYFQMRGILFSTFMAHDKTIVGKLVETLGFDDRIAACSEALSN